ncbi:MULTISPECIES: hypothetical protein [Streptomyces]|uniref:hypothetical protein n=1 Tax=Streptomyces TaxID=1883 RepID=UPI001164963F|nr:MULTISPECIES: hypothetical protein [unclassified Streptomyces]NMI54696.1 hypothetical protein [Streptomyces sp. RLA2-12]QDN62751.1 hypothetical protein FNV67_52845 [Streptomyces sp. S1D4-20]QDN72801.1 hypothetical protein FNV66_51695 [Streptomyces sp. S1D4-14]QDN83106.1 hypothetical protein FNV64_53385 [Streptomyces sp. S1A1-7]QDO55328.1 hypothetical protein FNV60_50580 [Streptomyces sp. RLB3-5]
MASVVGLLEARELAARERVEGLREEVDRVLAELADAETDWKGWVIARQRVGEVFAESPKTGASAVAPTSAGGDPARVASPEQSAPSPARPVRPGSIVPVWRPGLAAGALAVDYQRILALLAGRSSPGGETVSCQELAAGLGLEPTSANIEGRVRSRAKRLTDRGWLAEPVPGRFTLAVGPAADS